jgi:hypothetical protein
VGRVRAAAGRQADIPGRPLNAAFVAVLVIFQTKGRENSIYVVATPVSLGYLIHMFTCLGAPLAGLRMCDAS